VQFVLGGFFHGKDSLGAQSADYTSDWWCGFGLGPALEARAGGGCALCAIMPRDPNRRWELICMKLGLLLAFSLVYGSLTTAQEVPTVHARFFNDSAKTVNFFVDDQFTCSVPANPEENNAYCDADVAVGKLTFSVKGPKLSRQSCNLFIEEAMHAEALLSKGELFHCRQVFGRGN
jgi:hypothetical protein